jgi:NADPH:quinone reductase
LEAGFCAAAGDQLVKWRIVLRRGEPQRDVTQLGQRESGFGGEWMGRWQGDGEGLVPDGQQLDFADTGHVAHERRVQLASADLGDALRRRRGDEPHLKRRSRSRQFGEDVLEALAKALAGAQAQNPFGSGGDAGGDLLGPLGGLQHGACVGQQAFTGRCESYLPGSAVEQLDAQLAFEPADLLADCGLDDVQSLRSATEAQFLGHGGEVGQLPDLHAASHPSRFVIAAGYNCSLVSGCSVGGLVVMKAILNTPNGVSTADVADPCPAADEALVAVRAFSINRGEIALLATRTNQWRPGQDVAGVVVEPAADGSGPPPGSRVVALVEEAGWAELAAVPTARLATVPDSVRIEQAAALPLAGLTALRTLRLGGDLLGRRVLVTGANGALGAMQVQLAVAAGAEVTAVARPQHDKRLQQHGARSVVADPSDADGLFHLVADWIGGASLAAALAKVTPGGTVVVGSGSPDKTSINIYDFFGHEGARLVGYLSYAHPDPPGPDLATLTHLVATGRLDPPIGLLDTWTRLPQAITALTERRISGKAVLTTG